MTKIELESNIEEAVNVYRQNHHYYREFLEGVLSFIRNTPCLHDPSFPVVHSVKSREKDIEHLKDKIRRKATEGKIINGSNVLQEIHDLIGVRILHIYQDQFPVIHKAILEKCENDYSFVESPKAYTWDPESKQFYENLGIETEIKDSYYTSIHYIVKPKNNSSISCEIQVRTLFEEIWGEISHSLNYPKETGSLACKEQLKVLSKLVSTGTRLADAIFRTYNEYNSAVHD